MRRRAIVLLLLLISLPFLHGCLFCSSQLTSKPIATEISPGSGSAKPKMQLDHKAGLYTAQYDAPEATYSLSMMEYEQSNMMIIVFVLVPVPVPSGYDAESDPNKSAITRLSLRITPKTSGLTFTPMEASLIINDTEEVHPIKFGPQGEPVTENSGPIPCDGAVEFQLLFPTKYMARNRYTLVLNGIKKDGLPTGARRFHFKKDSLWRCEG